ncbi:MAG: sigma 54-interacting transcriptional regulator [Acidobacteriota bacterium]
MGRRPGDRPARPAGHPLSLLFATRNRQAAELSHTLARLAPSGLTILLEGETGAGKSYLAAALHRRGRAGRPLVVVDCGAIPETLLAAELFGHTAGAFTDATRARTGALLRAGDGTVVLDRIDALAPEAQVTLLRALDERRVTPVGSQASRPVAARIIALAGAGLTARLDTGEFRSDLYHRIGGFHAQIPPLRRRPEDILPHAAATLRRFSRHSDRKRLDPEAAELLVAHPWPGNFRELETVLERGSLRSSGAEIHPADLALGSECWPQVMALAAERRLKASEVTRLYALLVLADEGGNVSRTARSLGLSRRTLIRWRKE